jgi:putative FmdB family regulatory protein
MPVYEYQCTACSHEFEREQRISEDPIKKCPKCGKLKVKRLISRTSFVLKGGGWYSDLYGSAKPAGDAKGDAKEAAPSAGSDAAAKSESKSADAKPAEAKPEKKSDKKKSGKAAA